MNDESVLFLHLGYPFYFFLQKRFRNSIEKEIF